MGVWTGKQYLSEIGRNELTCSSKKAAEESLAFISKILAGKLIVNTTDATSPTFNNSSSVLLTLSFALSSYASISLVAAIPSPFLSIEANKNLIARRS